MPTAAPAASSGPAPRATWPQVSSTIASSQGADHRVGSTVTWTNNGNNIHTLTSADGLFDSGGLLGGQSFSFSSIRQGAYRLICRQHGLNGMAAQVIVQ